MSEHDSNSVACAVKERPILFSAPMVQAILAGRKTQTRRVVKDQPPSVEAVRDKAGIDYGWIAPDGTCDHFRVAGPVWAVRELWEREPKIVPRYRVGDGLWVRETWGHTGSGVWSVRDTVHANDGKLIYRATDEPPCNGCWFPSIHMPRWASRITLEVTEVRVERIASITNNDAVAEGVSCKDEFISLWKGINGDSSWDRNVWVWVLVFRVV